MKKSILFVNYYLGSGGAERALVNLLDMFDYDKYDVDLLLFKQEGLYMDQLNENVNLLPVPPEIKAGDTNKKYIINSIKNGKLVDAFYKAFYFYAERIIRKPLLHKVWPRCWKNRLIAPDKEYDIAVGYLQGLPLIYVADIVKARYKVGWIHNYYASVIRNVEFDYQIFKKYDRMVSVSEECTQSIVDYFPDMKNRSVTLLNLTNPYKIIEMSKKDGGFDDGFSGIRLLTIGGLRPQKNYEMALEAMKILKDHNQQVKWYAIGAGRLQSRLLNKAKELGIDKDYVFIGETSNPYTYIRQADIYVQPSKFEGKSIAIDEAKILKKPIVVTNFSSVYDQLKHNETGIITEMKAEAIAEGIEKLIEDKELRDRLVKNLESEGFEAVEAELDKHYQVFEGKL